MICNKCGAKNSDKREKCFNCGNVLIKEHIEIKRDIPGEYSVEPLQEDDSAEDYSVEPLQEEYDESYDEDDYTEEAEESYSDMEKQKKPKKKGLGITIAIWALAVVFVSVLVIAGIMLYMYFTEQDSQSVAPTQTNISTLNVQAPTVTKERDDDGEEYLHVVFYGEPGDRIFLACNNSSATFIENTLEMDLYLKDLFSTEYEFKESTVMANMNAYLVRNNTKYACNVPAYSLSVPEAETEMLAPVSTTQKVYSDKYNIKLFTSTDSKISLNNTDITSYIDGLGTLTYPIDVKENTNTTYQLEVTQPYHTPKSVVFILSRDALPVTLTIATSNASIISDSSITISGSTEPNVEITSNLPILDLQINTLYNTYNVVLDLSTQKYGQIEATVTATNSKGSSTLSHTFWYWPDETAVTTASSKLTTAVISDCASYKDMNFVAKEVTAIRIVSADLFEATVNISGTDYNILISNEYEKSANVKVGSSYKVFARCEGYEQDSMPVFKGWYIYKN